MKTKLGEIRITNNKLQIIDLDSMDYYSEDFINDDVTDKYGIIEFGEYNLFFAAVENKLYNVFGIKSKNEFQEWDELVVELNDEEISSTEKIGELYTDSTSLIIYDSSLINNWSVASVDGLANVVCWGRHASKIANKLDLEQKRNVYGWFGIPSEKADEYIKKIKRKKRFWYGLQYFSEPHSSKNILRYSIEESKNNVSDLAFGSNKVIGLGLHQDGIWPIYIDFSKNTKPCRIRISLK
ncbi:hypothetical protein [Flagellimonas algicola]|uniref:Uncharacterized protein n=1 Tax=Flagellimonas algicola TaxID=2583815 RepID=A0ABY2WMR4_9FLAO|nr:hypothetical protein [Allomuricauda algicola]TMU56032.1 hypothetical protein FGG15_00370 [Allomuricauda algicola]